MWKVKQFLTRSIGKFTFKRFRWVCFLFCFLLSVIDSTAQAVTNVDFVVISGLHDIPGSSGVPDLSIWNRRPSGRMLFWTVLFDENQNRGTIYRSESGHIGFIQIIDGTEYFLIADETGSPCRWMLESHPINVSRTYMDETRSFSTYVPSVWAKTYFDVFGINGNAGRGSLYKKGEGVIQTSTYEGVVLSDSIGNCSFKWRKYSMGGNDYYGVVAGIWGETVNWGQWEPWWFQGSSDYYSLHAVWRANYFDVELEFFRSLLDSKWWITGEYSVHWSHGITGIGHGTGEQGVSGAPAPSGGASTSVPGDILNPPITPLGDNGRWVYDPEKGLWQWQGDIADNVNQINPYDNSVMPENSGTIEGKWATESTLRRVLQTLEGFQREQGITSEQLQAMIDSGVVSIVDGMVQYWEGKNLVEAIDNQGQNLVDVIDDRVSGVTGRLSIEGAGIKNAINQHKQISSAISSRVSGLETGVSRVNTSIGAVNASIGEAKSDIVDAISNITIPENPTVEGQETESYEITAPDLSSHIDGWFAFDFPQLTIARQFVFEDYEIGVFDWKIPFSAFNDSSLRIVINTVRNILTWLVYLSAVLGVFKAMGGGV